MTILVDVVEAGAYFVKANTNAAVQQLTEERRIDDVVHFGEPVCYKYIIKDSKSDVQIRISTFSGMISYTFNPKSIPQKNQTASFAHNGTNKNSILLVTASERKKVGLSSGPYYLCIDPLMSSTYSVVIDEIQSDRKYSLIRDGHD